LIGIRRSRNLETEIFTIGVMLAGLAAGLLHTVLGPDHVAAVALFAANERDATGRTGFVWGVGHAAGALVIGALAMALREVFHAQFFSSIAERMVGLALIGIGLWGLHRSIKWKVHEHGHYHEGAWHAHHHAHTEEETAAHDDHIHMKHIHASFGVGMLSGLAGGSHILAVSPALAMPTAALSAIYLGMFAVGSVGAMTFISMAAGGAAARLSPLAGRRLTGALSALAIVVGVIWLAM